MVTNEFTRKHFETFNITQTNKVQGAPLSNAKQTMVLNSYFSENCSYSLKVAPVMRLKSKECILDNQTDSVKAEDEILYI